MPAIELRDVSFGYEPQQALLHVPELLVEEGERVFLYGPSGSGKSTLLGLIAGIHTAQAGTVEVLGKDLAQLSLSARDRHRGAEMGYIFQSFNLIPYLSVRQNIGLPCDLHGKRRHRIAASSVSEEISRIAARLDIGEFLDRPVTKLSTGQQQRVAIARAVIGAPRLVIADEPTSSLDRNRQENFLSLLIELCDETRATLLFVSHDDSLRSRFDRQISLTDINRPLPC